MGIIKRPFYEIVLILSVLLHIFAIIAGCILIVMNMSEILFGYLSQAFLDQDKNILLCFWSFGCLIPLVYISTSSIVSVDKIVKIYNTENNEHGNQFNASTFNYFFLSLFHFILLSLSLYILMLLLVNESHIPLHISNLLINFTGMIYTAMSFAKNYYYKDEAPK